MQIGYSLSTLGGSTHGYGDAIRRSVATGDLDLFAFGSFIEDLPKRRDIRIVPVIFFKTL